MHAICLDLSSASWLSSSLPLRFLQNMHVSTVTPRQNELAIIKSLLNRLEITYSNIINHLKSESKITRNNNETTNRTQNTSNQTNTPQQKILHKKKRTQASIHQIGRGLREYFRLGHMHHAKISRISTPNRLFT